MPRLWVPSLLCLAISCGGDNEPSGGDPPQADAAVGSDAAAGNDGSTPDVDGGALSGIPARLLRLVRSDSDRRLVIEIDSVAGAGPYPATPGELISALVPLLDKPDGIEATMDGTIPSRGADHAWTDEELFALADETFDLAVPDGTVKIHVLFLDGHRSSDTESGATLGLAWAHTHLVIFKDTLVGACAAPLLGPLVEQRLCENAEVSVWMHEVGHLIGLVGNGLPMVADHRDPDHGHHDVSDQCVMYWAYEGERVVELLRDRITGGDDAALGFDDACRADLRALRDLQAAQ